jgi:hypothetical protein
LCNAPTMEEGLQQMGSSFTLAIQLAKKATQPRRPQQPTLAIEKHSRNRSDATKLLFEQLSPKLVPYDVQGAATHENIALFLTGRLGGWSKRSSLSSIVTVHGEPTTTSK